jgi:hypothetical protein
MRETATNEEQTLPNYTPPELTKWQRERLEQGFFDWVLPSRVEWFVTTQAARILDLSADSVTYLATESHKLEIRYKQIKGERRELLISRRSLLLYIASTCQLDPITQAERFIAAINAVKCTKMLGLILEGVSKEYKRRTA